jgi:hypothetical protein
VSQSLTDFSDLIRSQMNTEIQTGPTGKRLLPLTVVP